MQDLAAAGPFVEIVYVLGDDVYFEIIFQFCQEFVRGIGMHFEQLSSPLIVKIVDQVRVDSKTLRRSHFIDVMSFPQAIGIPECFDPAFGADTGAGEYDEFLFHFSRLSSDCRIMDKASRNCSSSMIKGGEKRMIFPCVGLASSPWSIIRRHRSHAALDSESTLSSIALSRPLPRTSLING